VEWRETFEKELAAAGYARERGNEGMARVCARRAAGAVAGEALRRRSLPTPAPAYDRLAVLASSPAFPPEVHELAGRFLVRLNPDHQLPIDADLLADAHRLAELLLDQE